MRFLARKDLQLLLDALHAAGYSCIGPQVDGNNLCYKPISNITQLPYNQQDKQAPGNYKIIANDQQRYFAWANGSEAIKPLTFASRELLWQVKRQDDGKLEFIPVIPDSQPVAILGVKACDLAALHLQDQHFAFNTYVDHYYNARRRPLFLLAVDCSHPADTCFCAATGDGPNARSGFDVALTELDDGFLLRSKSKKGADIVQKLPTKDPTTYQLSQAEKQQQQAISQQQRTLGKTSNLESKLFMNLEHPRWEEIATRCLACGNCTSVCPTCFCHNEVEDADLDGSQSKHYRQWDSCFTLAHSYMHSLVLRDKISYRYRQWLTHKFGSWHEQYGRSGCVGCGRCITWCPVGIDVTVELQHVTAGDN